MDKDISEKVLGEETWPPEQQNITIEDICVLLEAQSQMAECNSNIIEFAIDRVHDIVAQNEGQEIPDYELLFKMIEHVSNLIIKFDLQENKDAKLFILLEWLIQRTILQRLHLVEAAKWDLINKFILGRPFILR